MARNRIAALVQMLRGDIRNVVCPNLDAGSTYHVIRNKLRNLVSNDVFLDAMVPSPIDGAGVG